MPSSPNAVKISALASATASSKAFLSASAFSLALLAASPAVSAGLVAGLSALSSLASAGFPAPFGGFASGDRVFYPPIY